MHVVINRSKQILAFTKKLELKRQSVFPSYVVVIIMKLGIFSAVQNMPR